MSGFKGDFLGFSYGTKEDGTPMHSSDLGIVRVSDGSRFNENLLPTMQDKTVQVPGGDGTYYFGSYYTQRQFTISFAFDSLTEAQLARLKSHFGDKGIHDLIFDECPYKVYSAKVTGTATIKHISFAEGATNRLYKGEGSIQFTCYNPFARSNHKFLDQYVTKPTVTSSSYKPNKYYAYNSTDKIFKLTTGEFKEDRVYYTNIGNINEWAIASGMKISQGSFDTYNKSEGKISLFNPGDFNAHFTLTLFFGDYTDDLIPAGSMYLATGEKISWNDISKKGEDTYIVFNSKLNLIQGGKSGKKTGNIYNQYIKSGAFFTIPKGESNLLISTGARPNTGEKRANINYDYCYL